MLADDACRLLVIAVEDADQTAFPTLPDSVDLGDRPRGAESGWGLPLVALLAEECGVIRVPVGKRVWFTLKLA